MANHILYFNIVDSYHRSKIFELVTTVVRIENRCVISQRCQAAAGNNSVIPGAMMLPPCPTTESSFCFGAERRWVSQPSQIASRESNRLNDIREHLFIMPVPVALEPLLRIVLPLQPEKFRKLRITALDLASRRPPVIGRKVASAVL